MSAGESATLASVGDEVDDATGDVDFLAHRLALEVLGHRRHLLGRGEDVVLGGVAGDVDGAARLAHHLDRDGDGVLDDADVDWLVRQVLGAAAGDADLDGEVTFADFLVVSTQFASAGSWVDGDFDEDGLVDFSDFLLLAANYAQPVAV